MSALRAVLLTALLLRPAAAFLPPGPRGAPRRRAAPRTSRPSAAAAAGDVPPSDVDAAADSALARAGDDLRALASSLAAASPSGRFLTRPSDARALRRAIRALEARAPPAGERERRLLAGDWRLVATATVPSTGVRRPLEQGAGGRGTRGGRFDDETSEGTPPNTIQTAMQKTVEVTQRIRRDGGASSSGDGNAAGEQPIDRVDNVIEFTPPNTLEDVFPAWASPLGRVNVNPLGVQRSKVVLIHTAEVESVRPRLRTKIAWVGSVLNVAGTSRYLNPEGEDVFGVNNLFGEFLGTGTFDTPFVDERIRVSRTEGPLSEQLRVFVRKGRAATAASAAAHEAAKEIEEEEAEAPEEPGTKEGATAESAEGAEATAEIAEEAPEEDTAASEGEPAS